VDITYYILKLLSWFGIVWDLRVPSSNIINKTAVLSPRIITQTSRYLANNDFEFKTVIAKLEAVKNEVIIHNTDTINNNKSIFKENEYFNRHVEKLYEEIVTICKMLESKLVMLDKLPLKLAEVIKNNVEHSISSLQKLSEKLSERLSDKISDQVSYQAVTHHLINTIHDIIHYLTFTNTTPTESTMS